MSLLLAEMQSDVVLEKAKIFLKLYVQWVHIEAVVVGPPFCKGVDLDGCRSRSSRLKLWPNASWQRCQSSKDPSGGGKKQRAQLITMNKDLPHDATPVRSQQSQEYKD